MMSLMNRLGTAMNQYQMPEKYKRVLTVCAGGCLRSPTAAWVLSNDPYNFNTRSAGCDIEFAIIPVDDILIAWADEIVFMEEYQRDRVMREFTVPADQRITVLDIPDHFAYRDPELVAMIKERYRKKYDETTESHNP